MRWLASFGPESHNPLPGPARSTLARPSRLLLLDEPEQSLDAGFRQELAALLRLEYVTHGGTVVMATHDLGFAAAAEARQVLLADGRLAAPGMAEPGP